MAREDRESRIRTLERAFDFAQGQVEALCEKYPPDYYPMYTVAGRYGRDRKRWTHWCDGFYPGLMFIFAEATGDGRWLDRARRLGIEAAHHIRHSQASEYQGFEMSLYKGELAVALLLADLQEPDTAVFPFFGSERPPEQAIFTPPGAGPH